MPAHLPYAFACGRPITVLSAPVSKHSPCHGWRLFKGESIFNSRGFCCLLRCSKNVSYSPGAQTSVTFCFRRMTIRRRQNVLCDSHVVSVVIPIFFCPPMCVGTHLVLGVQVLKILCVQFRTEFGQSCLSIGLYFVKTLKVIQRRFGFALRFCPFFFISIVG
jgi:hypothetical protein